MRVGAELRGAGGSSRRLPCAHQRGRSSTSGSGLCAPGEDVLGGQGACALPGPDPLACFPPASPFAPSRVPFWLLAPYPDPTPWASPSLPAPRAASLFHAVPSSQHPLRTPLPPLLPCEARPAARVSTRPRAHGNALGPAELPVALPARAARTWQREAEAAAAPWRGAGPASPTRSCGGCGGSAQVVGAGARQGPRGGGARQPGSGPGRAAPGCPGKPFPPPPSPPCATRGVACSPLSAVSFFPSRCCRAPAPPPVGRQEPQAAAARASASAAKPGAGAAGLRAPRAAAVRARAPAASSSWQSLPAGRARAARCRAPAPGPGPGQP